MLPVDSFDRDLVAVLQQEGRIANVQLAERVHLSESACLRRVRTLESQGVIQGYSARVDPQKVGLSGIVFVSITLERQDQDELRVFEEAVRALPEVMDCYLMTGEFDYLLRVVVADTEDFERIHSQQLTRLPGVARVHSSFALRTVQKSAALPIRQLDP
ncbi:MAG TPA: Lrp/AsnC family transcriptional regulator [Myxococcales bacterium]|nr:Lrp/AsnC family transcriptional regulator [Myxococcales bacterium]